MFRHREAVTWKILSKFFEALHKENTTRKVFVAGYCWGARYGCLLTQRERWTLTNGSYKEGGLVDAVFSAHPCEYFLGTIPIIIKEWGGGNTIYGCLP